MLTHVKRSLGLAAVVLVLSSAAPLAQDRAADAPIAPLLEGLGDHEWAVTTSVPRARQFFNQGLRLLYAFNFPEALRAFREAARLDPSLAMAYWGQAMAVGPNLNAPLTPENAKTAYEALGAYAEDVRAGRQIKGQRA